MSENERPTIDVERRFGGLARLYGLQGALKIRASHVVVIGIGGVGSWAAEALARSGVGQLTLIDLDHVAESNINRQVLATEATVGQAKILAMRDRVALINPDCRVNCIDDFVTPENWLQLLPDGVDAVIDACDQTPTKVALAAWARVVGSIKSPTKMHFITVGAAGGKRLAHLVDIADLSQITHDPLLAQVRYSLRKHHHAPRQGRVIGVSCVFSKEAVKQPDKELDASFALPDVPTTDGSLNCSGYGSVVSVTATFGQCAAGWVLDKLATFSNPLERSA